MKITVKIRKETGEAGPYSAAYFGPACDLSAFFFHQSQIAVVHIWAIVLNSYVTATGADALEFIQKHLGNVLNFQKVAP